MKTYCIGDIHGNYLGLIDVIDKINLSKEDTLIVLGDLCDGCPQTPEVLDYLIELYNKCNLILIYGNHDDWLVNWLEFKNPSQDWLDNGGKETIKSYEKIPEETKQKHLEFIKKKSCYFYNDENNRVFVHGGFDSTHVRHEISKHTYYWNRKLWKKAMTTHAHSPKSKISIHDEIFIGHTATVNYNNKQHYPEADGTNKCITVPMHRCNVWNIDTGSGVYYGKLTIINVDTKEYFQSKRCDYYYDVFNDELVLKINKNE